MTEERAELLELYKVMVDTMTANEARRQQISSIFIALTAAGLGAGGTIETLDPMYLATCTLCVSVIWWSQVRYLKRLAKAKFKVINEIEEKLSFQPFRREWEHMGKLKSGRFKFGLAQFEMLVPKLVFFGSAAYLGLRFFDKMG